MSSVLVIDDSDTTRQFFESALEDKHDVFLAEGLDEARELVGFDDVDVIFLDCWLGDVEGIDVLEIIREESDVPVVMISGYADRSIVNKADQLGISQFLQKPLEPEGLNEALERALSGTADDGEIDLEEVEFYGTPRVLLVDDDQATLQLLSRPLDHYDLKFQCAESGDEAWQIYQEFEPEIVVLDARLKSDTSSIELHNKIVEHNEDVFFIGITGHPDADQAAQLRDRELVEIFYKPFAVDRFVRSLAHLSFVIDRRQQEGADPEVQREPSEDRFGYKRTLVIGAIFIVVGLMHGFAVKWTQEWASRNTGDQPSVQKMYEEIKGYLRRDEERDRQYQ